MDKQDYLDQISASVRPEKKSRLSLLSSPFFKVGAIGAIALIAIIFLGMLLGGGKETLRDQSYTLKLRLDNTLEVISNYQTYVKSSELRSNSASLYSILTNTNSGLSNYLVEKYDFKESSVSDKIVSLVTEEKETLENELFEARINGNLDRIYAHKMAYEISMIATNESSIYNASRDETLREVVKTSYDSLNNLYNKFNDFSETK